MFDPSDTPRVFGLPPGVDFGQAVINGLLTRCDLSRPEALAQVVILVNTRRMQRRLRDLFDAGPARLLPQIKVLSDLGTGPAAAHIPPAVPALRRRLELSQLVAGLLDRAPDLAPRSALFDLSDSLAQIMDELHGEGVDPAIFANMTVPDGSDHWERSRQFLSIVTRYFGDTAEAPDKEARQRRVVEDTVARWAITPPTHPILVAGSTGSRGATALLMDAVARLPQGAVILPGFDFDLPEPVWDGMTDPTLSEDHPQFRFKRLMDRLAVKRADIAHWHDVAPANPARNKLISLSLRPAPVTDQWRMEGAEFGPLHTALQGVTLIEAPSPRAEADTIALRLRHAVEAGQRAALITPDRTLTRQVAAALDRWNITPDDSAGLPLQLSPPGRFLRHVADAMARTITAETLLTLLKHPLCHSGGGDRGGHLLRTRRLELHLRRYGPAFPTGDAVRDWAAKNTGNDDGLPVWAAWLGTTLDQIAATKDGPLTALVETHVTLAETLAQGSVDGPHGLWAESAGREAQHAVADLRAQADAGGPLTALDYANLFNSILGTKEVRNPDTGHPNILFWGTLEARVQSADLVILGGMNDGVWPERPQPDPWLNRQMRHEAGLLLPERRIGLSAHDYQQAVAGREVWISRAIRSDEAETVPSRWLNRLSSLLLGLKDQGGAAAWDAALSEGNRWIAAAQTLSQPDAPVPAARRPSPRPPVAARPRTLAVTDIAKLIRDPFAVYARRVLGLSALDPLVGSADAPMKGTALHKVLEVFVKTGIAPDDPAARNTLMDIAQTVLEQECPWPTARRLWLASVDRFADHFLTDETARRRLGAPAAFETWGEILCDGPDVTLKGKADRIDLTPDGSAVIYDYKTGTAPTPTQQKHFDKQLLVEAAMIERGAFKDIGARTVTGAVFIGLGSDPKNQPAPLDTISPADFWQDLKSLLLAWQDADRGYSARLAHFQDRQASDYDHLSRFGEWDMADDIAPQDLT